MEKLDRRSFMQRSLIVGAGLLVPAQFSFGSDSKDEKLKEKNAKYIFNFSSPYKTENFVATPHAHLEIKKLIEQYTNNKVYVKIHDGGVDGTGTRLAGKVKLNKIQGALVSVSNLSPMIPEIDILNIPFWSSSPEEYTRLFNSSSWKNHILSKTKKHKTQVLFPYVVGARTATSTKKYGKRIVKPEDFEGVKFRIPGSKSLAVFYKLTKAIPQKFPWATAGKTARLGRYQAIDPSIAGLYAGPMDLKGTLGVISEVETVHDGWVAIGSTDFIESLDANTRIQFLDAMEEIQKKQRGLYQSAKDFCVSEFNKNGTKIYTPTQNEKNILADAFGHTNPAWDPVKKKLLGKNGMKIFDELYKAAKI